MGLAAGYALGIAALYIYLFAMPYDAEGAFQDVIKGMLSLAGSYILYLSIGVILALCAVLVLVYRLKKDSFAPVARSKPTPSPIIGSCAAIFLVSMIECSLSCHFLTIFNVFG